MCQQGRSTHKSRPPAFAGLANTKKRVKKSVVNTVKKTVMKTVIKKSGKR